MYGYNPVIADKVWIANNATVLGNVTIGEGSSIWYGAVVRCENTSIVIGKNTNVQDNCVLHVDMDNHLQIGDYVTIGHGALVHGCSVGSNTLIGMGAIILNNATIGDNCIIGAGALVLEGMIVPDNSLVVGSPAKVIRSTLQEDIDKIRDNAMHYVEMAHKYSQSPLTCKHDVENDKY